ncbi:unnamed protein product [Urochloa humidicola]
MAALPKEKGVERQILIHEKKYCPQLQKLLLMRKRSNGWKGALEEEQRPEEEQRLESQEPGNNFEHLEEHQGLERLQLQRRRRGATANYPVFF